MEMIAQTSRALLTFVSANIGAAFRNPNARIALISGIAVAISRTYDYFEEIKIKKELEEKKIILGNHKLLMSAFKKIYPELKCESFPECCEQLADLLKKNGEFQNEKAQANRLFQNTNSASVSRLHQTNNNPQK